MIHHFRIDLWVDDNTTINDDPPLTEEERTHLIEAAERHASALGVKFGKDRYYVATTDRAEVVIIPGDEEG